MKKLAIGLPAALLFSAGVSAPAAAQSECGEVSITEMNWASAQIVTAVSTFLMEQGYGCDVSTVPSDTVPAVTSLAENNEPDIVTELWLNSTGETYKKLEEQGKVERLTKVIEPGGVEGWWIPSYLAEEHPELTTIEGVMENPDLAGGRFHNCPQGWGCRIVNDNLIRAFDLEETGLEVFNHGSGETLATSMASAYQDREPWFGYYWGPTVPLGKFDMTRVDLGEYEEDVHTRNQNADVDNPEVSDFPAAPVLTVATADFSEENPEIAELMSNVSFDVDTLSAVLAWKDENNATAEEAAVHYLTTNQDTWSEWLDESARENLASVLEQ